MIRFSVFAAAILLTLLSLLAAFWSPWFLTAAALFGAFAAVGVYDVLQPKHAILRNYPILGHMRFIFEGIRPEIRQYLGVAGPRRRKTVRACNDALHRRGVQHALDHPAAGNGAFYIFRRPSG